MRKTIRASVLIMALAFPAFAGEIPNDVTAAGDMPTGGIITGEIPNDVTLLNLLLILL